MKRRICMVLCITLLGSSFFGCSKDDASAVQETLHPYIAELMDSLPDSTAEPLPDQILAETDEYTFHRKDGICYLDFKSGNYRIDIDEHNSSNDGIHFTSMEEMYQWLRAPEISAKTEETVRHLFILDEENGFILPDPEHLYTVTAPDGYSPDGVTIRNNSYTLYLKTQEHLDNGSSCSFGISFCSKDIFAMWLSNYHHFRLDGGAYDTYCENNITYYEWDVGDHSRNRCAQYCLEIGNRTLFVEETCRIKHIYDSSVSKETPDCEEISVRGCENGAFFSFDNICHRDCTYRTVSIDLGKELEITEYDPTPN